ncbi:protein of unknown function [Cardinium endosymbiont cEper1 of Encarsia pergandiella]|uniref:hypothetical protein n=1 Tax=Cardinium endosymbiont of Encarsia pergandiella TaxID=249402 RepID=UPI00027EAA14|nr:hypothetical protein [Cardinium endosymbiont of Encarsia pergandiella]CCM10482.1 protein of unknown function [Cardinium endosymbiont cEper1 of Encarsia pergandiella]
MKNNIKKFVYGSIVALSAYSCFDKPTPPNNTNHSGNKKLKEGGSKNLDASTKIGTATNGAAATNGTVTATENGTETRRSK